MSEKLIPKNRITPPSEDTFFQVVDKFFKTPHKIDKTFQVTKGDIMYIFGDYRDNNYKCTVDVWGADSREVLYTAFGDTPEELYLKIQKSSQSFLPLLKSNLL